MLSGDLLCRAALYPRFENNGRFSLEALFGFVKCNGGDFYALSLGNRQLLKTEEGVHGYGCNAAHAANGRFTSQAGREPTPKERVHYLGYYEFPYGAVAEQELDCFWVKVRWAPTEGEEHFQLELWDKRDKSKVNGTNAEKKAARRDDRIALLGAIAAKLDGPKRGTCAADAQIADHLSAVNLPPYPTVT